MKNMLNLVSRQVLLSECSRSKKLLPCASYCHGQHPLLTWHSKGYLTSESGVQRGDTYGPPLFSLVLNILVTAIAEDSACATRLVPIDDGDLAGPSSRQAWLTYWSAHNFNKLRGY